jgi:glutamate synthase (ferredoxin)
VRFQKSRSAIGGDFNISKLNQSNVKKLKIQNPVISKEDLDKTLYRSS